MITCAHCHADNMEWLEHCTSCGELLARPRLAPRAAPPAPATSDEVEIIFTAGPSRTGLAPIAKTCPYCQAAIAAADAVTVCPACRTPHHTECWQENGHCATYGCYVPGASLPATGTPPPSFTAPPPYGNRSSTTSTQAALSLVFGILSIITSWCCCGGVGFGVTAIILASIARNHPDDNQGVITAGLATGIIGLGASALLLLAILLHQM